MTWDTGNALGNIPFEAVTAVSVEIPGCGRAVCGQQPKSNEM